MVVVMKVGASEDDIRRVEEMVENVGGETHIVRGESRSIVALIGDTERFMALPLVTLPGVETVTRIGKPYKLVAKEVHAAPSTVKIGTAEIGRGTFTLIAGPCAVESREQAMAAVDIAKEAGASILRGGAYKPRTSPYAFQGLGEEGLAILAECRERTGLPVVTEVVEARDVDTVAAVADALQIGTRNMSNFALLKEVGKAGKPVVLKRGMSSTVEEWLMAAEYIAREGHTEIVLCERGIRTFEPWTRNTLDLGGMILAQQESHLPVIADPSHATGRRELVEPMARAALAAGADGVMVDVHPNPSEALVDGPQALSPEALEGLAAELAAMAQAIGKPMS
ncbi:MAG: 3-deoxy-7-phosphoheptulonate synthase [Actinomycetota bacterium]